MKGNRSAFLRMTGCVKPLVLASLAILAVAVTAAQEIRPGVWAGKDAQSLPLPAANYQAYLIGEQHGIAQNEEFELNYLAHLHRASGLRDVVFEEKPTYESQAQAYVEGTADTLPKDLCLRGGILGGIRLFNAKLPVSERIRVHFADLDSPADAIRQHLIAIAKQIPGAGRVRMPSADQIKEQGLSTVADLQKLNTAAELSSQLRTLAHSIRASQLGFEVGTGPAKGSPYLEDREQAIASNIQDLLGDAGLRSVLVLYGADHVSRKKRSDGGPGRDQPFSPMALRLDEAGIKLFSVVAFPLAGSSFWRGQRIEFPYDARDGHLASGETLDKLVVSVPTAPYIYIDTKREHVTLPSSDVTHFIVDGFLLFRAGTPMEDHCAVK